jgi:hypothetical protein
MNESPPFPEGLLADSVTRVWAVARTLIAVLESPARFTPASGVATRVARAAVVRQR